MFRFSSLFAVSVTGLLLAACTPASPVSSSEEGTIGIAASFYPLAHFAEQVGGERVHVRSITPSGVDPHDFEPSPRDLAAVYDASLFLFNGAGQDPWAERLKHDLEARGVMALEMIEHIDALRGEDGEDGKDGEDGEDEEDDHDGDHDDDHGHEHDGYDPHFWLDPVRVQAAVLAIRDALISINPEHEEHYRSNASAYIAELQDLHNEYAAGLSLCSQHAIVVAHDAFRYLAGRYGFETIAIAGLSPEEEPSPRRMAEIVDIVREKEITVIFFETLAHPRLSDTLARESGAETLVLNPIEGLTREQLASGATYLSLMRENLANLRIALQCR